ncbi:ANTAR domain-containing response regulator [Taklimakanibacter lacteus]|uniref:ANTAR domain-containing response regulator n=1 Tax=Taklimakanibacter lacteus TaxID=2268456 RepID=UPI000E66F7BF
MTGSELSILIIDENRVRAAIIEEGLREAGHARIAIISEMSGLVRRIEDAAPDVIVIDLENPNRDMLEDLFRVSRAVRKPVAMFVDKSDTAMIAAAIAAGVSAYVVDGLRKERVKAILDLAIGRFHAFERIREELETAKQELSDRKVVDRAKGILMKMKRISEEEAYSLLRQTAMSQNMRIAKIAEGVIATSKIFGSESK